MSDNSSRALCATDALLVIDVQVGLISGAFQEPLVLERINQAIGKVRAHGGRVIFIQHNHASFEPMRAGEPGWVLHPGLERSPEDAVVQKTASDAFFDTGLDDTLRTFGIERVLVSGLMTEYCVDATCRAALSRNYAVTLLSDAHTTGDAHLKAAQIIDHHNRVLANLAHPRRTIEVRTVAAV
ncbi:MAG: cysteine hydrolase family protein [Pseudomonadales bacterium]|nr:cysteine hydrolase [Pseudomonadales bacterium]